MAAAVLGWIGTLFLIAAPARAPYLAQQPAAAPPEAYAIIVHPSNPTNDLTLSALRRILLTQTQTWPHGRKITVVLREKGDVSRANLIRLVCRMSETEYDRHLLAQTYRGSVGWGPRSISSTDAMLRFVFNAPGAIGFVPANQTNALTKVLRIDGLAPGDPRYPLRIGNGHPPGSD